MQPGPNDSAFVSYLVIMYKRTISISLCAAALIWLGGCHSKPGGDSEAQLTDDEQSIRKKLDDVRREMIRATDNPIDRAAFEEAKVFTKIKDLEMSTVGLSVILPHGHKLLISFTSDYFQQHDLAEIAREALKTWRAQKDEEQAK